MATYEESDDTPAGLIPFRVGELWRWKTQQEGWRREVDDDRVILTVMREDIKALKRIGVALLISVVTGSASITIAVLLSTGKL